MSLGVGGDAPNHLRVEHLDEPLGITTPAPRLSWRLPATASRQVAYRIQADGWDSGRVESAESVLVPYAGPPIPSRRRVPWRVRVWTDAGPSAWSAWSWWETGLLRPEDWVARWIAPVEPGDRPPPGCRPAHVLEATFAVDGPVEAARLYATAHGLYEVHLDGVRVGDHELTPGFTSYATRLHVQTFDVSALLGPGAHEVRVVLSDGWWRGQVGHARDHDAYGSTLGFLAQLHAVAGGSDRIVLVTDDRWWCGPGEIVAADLIAGQSEDRLADRTGERRPVEVVDHPLRVLTGSPAPPVRRIEVLRPRSVSELGPGRHVVDLGQNVNGWVRLSDVGPAGTELVLTHGEALGPDGDVTVEHLVPLDWSSGERLELGQVDRVVSDGSGRAFEPRHTTHGFRYVRVEGHPGPLDVDDVAGVVVHSDLPRRGWFRCGDARLNALHEAVEWSFRTNACDIPTDCPQRERAGWTGDWQIFAPTAAFLYDVAGFGTKWLRDLAADQRPDGRVRNVVPDPAAARPGSGGLGDLIDGSSGWGDAAVLVPWALYRWYGDRRVLEEQWPSMVAWVEHQARAARGGRHRSRAERGAPLPHERFLWDTGFHWGEWCEPGREGRDHFVEHLGDDFGIVATAYFAHSAGTLADVAAVLDRPAEADRYRTLAEGARHAWQVEFLDERGDLRSDRQADHVRALAFGLVPDGLRARTADRLAGLVRAAGDHLDTGFLATPLLLPVLADAGFADLAFAVLLQDTPPSWLAMIDRGATTIWEHWDGVGADGTPRASLNHYSKGAVAAFLHQYVAGIRAPEEPAFRRVRVEPVPGGGIDWAEAVHESPYGRIESAWWRHGARFELRVRVPPGTAATVVLPDGRRAEAGPGTSTFAATLRPGKG